MKTIIPFLALILTGLSAGLFYAWQVSVITGTKHISDMSYLETMQSINRAILNPGFYIIFFGSLIMLFLSVYQNYGEGVSATFWLALGAALAYAIGSFGVTMLGNVPLNEALDQLNLKELSRELSAFHRESFETKWNQWHTIRTIFSVLAFMLFTLSVVFRHGRI